MTLVLGKPKKSVRRNHLTNDYEISSIAIGSFDGIHLAHRKLIEQANMVLVIERGKGYLTPGYKRSLYCDKPMTFYLFDKISHLSPAQFIAKLKNDFPKLKKIVVGYDFKFGKDKSGDAMLLKELFDGETMVIAKMMMDGIPIHSRTIKEYILENDIKNANKMLGRNYTIDGQVIVGQGLGTKELVPTLNLRVEDYTLPKDGVFASRTKVANKWYKSVSFVGHRVSTDESFAVETHVIDKDLGIAQGTVWIEFIASIRENKKFNSLVKLKIQIEKDICSAKELLIDKIKGTSIHFIKLDDLLIDS